MAWKTPEEVFGPDIDPDNLYIGVGRALSQWEALEFEVAFLYAVFKGLPRVIDLIKDYGKQGRIFDSRLQLLSDAANQHFRKKPSQESEGRLSVFVDELRKLADKRHHIAHGIVTQEWDSTAPRLQGFSPRHFALVPLGMPAST
jgi:hypothetical protein